MTTNDVSGLEGLPLLDSWVLASGDPTVLKDFYTLVSDDGSRALLFFPSEEVATAHRSHFGLAGPTPRRLGLAELLPLYQWAVENGVGHVVKGTPTGFGEASPLDPRHG